MLTLQASSISTRVASATRQALPRQPVRAMRQGRRQVVVRANFLEGAINQLTIALKNSPLNAGKKALAVAQAGDYNVAETKALLDQYIKDNNVVVFSWTTCPFCVKAKQLLDEVGAKYTAVELNTMGPTGYALRAELAKMTDRTSVPNIFIAGQNVGGCNDGPGVITLHGKGELVPLLKAAGAL